MATLTEIEAAVDQLSAADREVLRRRLVVDQPAPPPTPAESREAWMERLAKFRASIGRQDPTVTVEQILEDTRAERV